MGKEHALYLQQMLEKDYKITFDWTGTRYINIPLDWDSKRQQVHLSMPGYIKKALVLKLKHFEHKPPEKSQHAPFQAVVSPSFLRLLVF